ncbi:hypothetical protein EDD18DRAFT_1468251 [Armillaria luteobubalina]|uniref:Uncharacterized protein n=1 Tax=Armillaria luteobubalina TaxID=153913 RepID=A0AA39UJA1_9AGAR|nr:hypothetical protein EDD18DRAFT_1468251 [Armillaria luteobubalina]
MVSLIVFLYICATVYVASDWVYAIYYSIENGNDSSSLVYSLYRTSVVALGIITGTNDAITIWRCWIVWGCRWSFIIPAILLLLAQGVCGCFAFQKTVHDAVTTTSTLYKAVTAPETPMQINWTMMFLSFSLGTTLWCTTFIIYRILTVKKCTDDCTGTRAYHRVIEILVESASLNVVGLIGWIILNNINVVASFYAPSLYISLTAISPTLIVARVASGHARPDDDWQANNVGSSLRFGSVVHSTSTAAGNELSPDIDLEHGGSGRVMVASRRMIYAEKGTDAPKKRRPEAICDRVG